MDRDDADMSDRSDQARQGDTGMIGSESEEPGPGRDTSLTDPDPAAASTDQPRTVAMSEGDPMATRLGSHVEGAGVIGHDVAAAEEGATSRQTPAEDRPGYRDERPVGDVPMATAPVTATTPTAFERDPDLAAEPVVDQESYGQDPGRVGGEPVEDVGPSDRSVFADASPAPERPAFATEDAGSADRTVVAEDPARFGAGDAMADPGRAGAAGYEGEPGGAGTGDAVQDLPATPTGEEGVDDQEGVYDQEADQARRRRPSDGL